MDKGWEVSEDQYLEHLMTNNLYNPEQTRISLAISTQTFNEHTPKGRSRLRFRTSSMPKLTEEQSSNEALSPKKVARKPIVQNESKSPMKSPLKTPLMRVPQKIQRIKNPLYQVEEGKLLGRTLQPKQFNPLATLKATEPLFHGLKGQTRSVKSASMSNIFNDERLQRRRIEDFIFKLKPQRNTNIIYMNVAIRSSENEDLLLRRFAK